MPVANKLKELRHDHRMNQTEFADFLSISVYQYNRYENGVRQLSEANEEGRGARGETGSIQIIRIKLLNQ